MTRHATPINSIGNTPLVRLQLAKDLGLSENFYVKDEGANPYGTVKDRRNHFVLQQAVRLGVDKLVLITSGNCGYSLAKLAEGTDIQIVCIIDRQMPAALKVRLQQVSYHVIEVNLQHKILRTEEVISFAREKEDEVIWDVTNGYEESYGGIVQEVRTLSPQYIVVPVGSGELFTGVAEAVNRQKLSTKVIGVGVQNTSASLADKLFTPWTPYARYMRTLEGRGHIIYRLSEKEVADTYKKYQHIVSCEVSSSVVFAAIQQHGFTEAEKVVFVNSARAAQ